MPAPPLVLVTRSLRQGSELAERLRALGAEPVLIPSIETVEPASFAALDAALPQLNRFHWLLFTSANAVEVFDRRIRRNPMLSDLLAEGEAFTPGGGKQAKLSLPADLRIAAIGPATARALEEVGCRVSLVPPQAIAESLTNALLPHAQRPDGGPARFLLVRAEDGREYLPDTLREAGAEVVIAAAYRTVIPEDSAKCLHALFAHGTQPLAAITFTSSSTARNLVALCAEAGVALPASVLRISIGPITSQTLRELDLPPHAESPEATVSALAQTVIDALHTP